MLRASCLNGTQHVEKYVTQGSFGIDDPDLMVITDKLVFVYSIIKMLF